MKRNQIMISALAVMLAIAGYLNFAGEQIEDEMANVQVVDNDENVTALLDLSQEDIMSDIESLDTDEPLADLEMEENLVVNDTVSDVQIQTDVASVEDSEVVEGAVLPEDEIPGEAVYTASNAVSTLSAVRLLKEQTRAKNKETLLEIINSTTLSESQKQDAVNDMIAMTDTTEKETAAEILLETKGFAGAVVSISDNKADVVVNAKNLTDAQLAQIEDIVIRKTGISAENIVISPLAGK